MSDVTTLQAQRRDRVGKGASRALRREDRLPAVIYGDKKDPIAISLDRNTIEVMLNKGGFMTRSFVLEVDKDKVNAVARDVQTDPVSDVPVHIDFLRVGKDTLITVNVPVHFINEDKAPGLKAGGVLNVVRHDVEVLAPATAIPDAITVDLSGYDLGDAVHVSSVTLPEKVTPTITDRDFTIATIATPSGLKSEQNEEDEAIETEVINEKAQD